MLLVSLSQNPTRVRAPCNKEQRFKDKTTSLGVTLDKCIKGGVDRARLGPDWNAGKVGILFGDAESVKAWRALCEQSEVAFQKVYDTLRVDERLETRGESFYNNKLGETVEAFTYLNATHLAIAAFRAFKGSSASLKNCAIFGALLLLNWWAALE